MVNDPNSRWTIFRDDPNHGWLPWRGGTTPHFGGDHYAGPRPIEGGTVDVWLRSGRIIFYRSPKGIGGRKNPGGGWIHLGLMTDIVAYRIHPEPVYLGLLSEEISF